MMVLRTHNTAKGWNIVVIDIGGGNKISSTISMNAIRELGLAVGKDAYAGIKATSVMAGGDE